jgi:hypothetical protein
MSAAGPVYLRQHFDIRRCTKKIEDLYDDISSAPTTADGMRQLA